MRLSLSTRDAPRLFALIDCKDILLDNLNRLEEAKCETLENLMVIIIKRSARGQLTSQGEILGVFNEDEASRLVRLQEGILLLMEQTYEMTHVNHALAACELERASAYTLRWREAFTQSHGDESARMPQPDFWQHAHPAGDQLGLPALLAAIIAAHDALDVNDHTGIPRCKRASKRPEAYQCLPEAY